MVRVHLCTQVVSSVTQASDPNTNKQSAEGEGRTSSSWAAAYIKARAFVDQLDLEEKVNLTVGYTGPCGM